MVLGPTTLSDAVIESLLSPDRRLWIEFRKRDDGTYAFGVCQWFDKDPDNPYEREPGYWFPISGSGVYDTLETAKVEAASYFPQFFGGEKTVSDLTPLESAVLAHVLRAHADLPPVELLRVLSRENTGVGRYTELAWPDGPMREDIVIAPPILIEMDGIDPSGMSALLFVRPDVMTLELFTFVGDWDGVEREWIIKESVDDR